VYNTDGCAMGIISADSGVLLSPSSSREVFALVNADEFVYSAISTFQKKKKGCDSSVQLQLSPVRFQNNCQAADERKVGGIKGAGCKPNKRYGV
jgi:hypothetical protein